MMGVLEGMLYPRVKKSVGKKKILKESSARIFYGVNGTG
jgi:hypothetical protein